MATEALELVTGPNVAEAPEPEKPRRGRPPKSDARPSDGGSSEGTEPRPRRTYTRRKKASAFTDEERRAGLVMLFGFAGGILSIPMHVTGTTIMDRAEKAADALLYAARDDPKMLAWIDSLLTVSRWTPLAMVGSEVATAVTVDLHILPPEHPLVQKQIGDVLDAHFRVVPSEEETPQNGQAAAEAFAPSML
jgi:hypothetical protein